MHRRSPTLAALLRAAFTAFTAYTAFTAAAQAQPISAAATPTSAAGPAGLQRAFEAAWARQPEALAWQARRDASRAQQQAAQAWTPEPAALELASQTDRLNRNQGARELEVGVAVPLWLPGERSRSAALADAESAAVDSHARAAQLRLAASVREAWWQAQRARIDLATARAQLDNTQQIAADVARRTKAGDLSRADQHQADGAVAGAQAGLAQAEAQGVAAHQQLRALTGLALADAAETWPETMADTRPEPDPGAASSPGETHAALQDLEHRAAVAARAAELATTQSRANPELVLATTRNRASFGEPTQSSLTLALRIPFGGGPRHDARSALARAEATETQARLALERERLLAEGASASARVQAARRQLDAAERRAQLARESRGFFDKSFRLGETDLPTRLRIEAEAAEAERQAARTRIDLAAAISAWRQALGLLPQ